MSCFDFLFAVALVPSRLMRHEGIVQPLSLTNQSACTDRLYHSFTKTKKQESKKSPRNCLKVFLRCRIQKTGMNMRWQWQQQHAESQTLSCMEAPTSSTATCNIGKENVARGCGSTAKYNTKNLMNHLQKHHAEEHVMLIPIFYVVPSWHYLLF